MSGGLGDGVAGGLTHLDGSGHARMVDVGGKPTTARVARASCRVRMADATLRLIVDGAMPKGDVLAVARVAGIMAAKRTAELIPLCHPLPIDAVAVDLQPDPAGGALVVEARVATNGRTGVEMEALTAASVAALTIYDMCKAVDRAMRVDDLHVIEKTGGRSGAGGRDHGREA